MDKAACAPLHKRALTVLTVLAIAAVHAGCGPSPEEIAGGDDPLAALTVGVSSSVYTGLYWRGQHKDNTALFEKAVSYCKDQNLEEKPNCAAVLQARDFIEARNQARPQGRGHTGILEEDKAPSDSTSGRPDNP